MPKFPTGRFRMPALWISDCTTTESRDGLLLAQHRHFTNNSSGRLPPK